MGAARWLINNARGSLWRGSGFGWDQVGVGYGCLRSGSRVVIEVAGAHTKTGMDPRGWADGWSERFSSKPS